MKKRISCGCAITLFLFLTLGTSYADRGLKYKISGNSSATETLFSLSQLEGVAKVRTIFSAYFDRVLNYQGSRLRVISFSELLERYRPSERADAALLNCFDDYQGIISLEDIRRYDLQLATRIEVEPQFKVPDWLNPLMIIVPDGSQAPYQERFVTANIREIKFVRLDDYYAPLRSILQTIPEVEPGLKVFKDNCLFCHSLKGIGGNKGVRLLQTYDFSGESGSTLFQEDFFAFHGNNPVEQNIGQFVSKGGVIDIGKFLRATSLAE